MNPNMPSSGRVDVLAKFPPATGCGCKDCVPSDPKVAMKLALARTDGARMKPSFYPGKAGNEITIYARDYDVIRAALSAITEPQS